MQTDSRYERRSLPLSVRSGLGPKHRRLEVQKGTLHVRFGGFCSEVPLTSITYAERNTDRVYTCGGTAWRGRWLVNGSSKKT